MRSICGLKTASQEHSAEGTNVNRTKKPMAWLCIYSTLLMGCYGSVLIDPKGDESARVYSDEIKFVLTKDGTKYVFEKPPVIVNDTIVGEVKVPVAEGMMTKKLSVPLSDVAEVSVKEYNQTWTTVSIVLGGLVLLLGILAIIDPFFHGPL